MIDALEQVAKNNGHSIAQVSLAWMLSKPYITAPIIRSTSPKHIEEAIAVLTEDENKDLESPYVLHIKIKGVLKVFENRSP